MPFDKQKQSQFWPLLNSVSQLTIRNGISVIGGFFSVLFFTRLLDVEDYGRFNYIQSWVGVVSIFSLPGINTAIMQAAARDCDHFFIEGTCQRLRWSFIGAALLLAGAGYAWMKAEQDLCKALLITALTFPTYSAFNSFEYFLMGKRQYGRIARYRLATVFVPLLLTVGVLLVTRKLVPVVLSMMVSTSLVNIAAFYRIALWGRLNLQTDETSSRFGIQLSGLTLISMVQQNLDRLILGSFYSFESLSLYALGKNVAEQTKEVWTIIYYLIFPKLADSDRRIAFMRLWESETVKLISLYVFLNTLLIAMMPVLLPLLFTDRYQGSVFFAQLFILAAIFAIIGVICDTFFQAQKMVRNVFITNSVDVCVYLLLLPVLLWLVGVPGIIGAKLCSATAHSLTGFILIRQSACRLLVTSSTSTYKSEFK